MANLTREEGVDAVLVFHNSGSVIFWYYKQQGEQYERDYQLAQRLSAKNGYKLIEPEDGERGAGGYKDWFIDEFKRPGFTVEVGVGQVREPDEGIAETRYKEIQIR